MKNVYDLSELDWTVEGYTPYVWLFERMYGGMGGPDPCVDTPSIPAQVPGSVQNALLKAGILPDWNIGENWRACEWVEHRHWMFRTVLPDGWLEHKMACRLECLGLDYSGWIYLNRNEVAAFEGTHIPHRFDITPFLQDTHNVLEIIFDLPPRWLGQFGYTSQMKAWKTRFNYTWDWSPRLVQVGIWDSISLIFADDSEFYDVYCLTDVDLRTQKGILKLNGGIRPGNAESVHISLEQSGDLIRSNQISLREFERGVHWDDLPIALWWPNLEGDQPLYTLTCRLEDAEGAELDRVSRRIGFKHVEWKPCVGSPAEADPWLCVVNGRPVFLQGVNFAPLCANFADLKPEQYERRLRQYHALGLNLFRINACQFLEREWFYDLCDELGLMIWQEFPLTSSGLENWPPEDEVSIASLAKIAKSFVARRHHHAALLMWSGGNELQGDMAGRKTGFGKPCDGSHPMLQRLQEVVQKLDPIHRYIPTSPLGPLSGADIQDFGKGLHWDVHGPNAAMRDEETAKAYWDADDALFRSEVYCSGASSTGLVRKYAGEMQVYPAKASNPYWARLTTWWLDWHLLAADHGREPADLDEYVNWSQTRQVKYISMALEACKKRFPRCGGFLLWSGHDTFPLTINSSIIDFDGQYKPAAFTVSSIWRTALPGEPH